MGINRGDYPQEFLELLKRIKGKRSKLVINYILEHGRITTEELASLGYNHPPRAARDVREQGVPLKTVFTKDSDGKRMAVYEFGSLSEVRKGKIGGRRQIPKRLKKKLIEESGPRCQICCLQTLETALQVDHRIPYEVLDDSKRRAWVPKDYMLLCGSCQRAKSWSCEHCNNWNTTREATLCKSCYWANPQEHKHLGLKEIRRIDMVWSGEDVAFFNKLEELSKSENIRTSEYVKKIIRSHIRAFR